MKKKYAFLVFILQIAITIWFAKPAIVIPQDNSLESFVVKSTTVEEHHRIFSENFSNDKTTILSIEFSSMTSKNKYLAEKILEKLASEPGVIDYHSYALDIPNALKYDLESELSFSKISKELMFPFVKENFYTALLLFTEENAQQQRAVNNILEKIKFIKKEYSQVKSISFAGAPVVGHYLGLSSLEVKDKFFPALILFCALVMTWVFRSIKVILVWLLAVFSSLTISMGIFSLAGNSLNLITNLIPVLIFVLSTAMQMHILLSLIKFPNIIDGLKEKLIPNFLVTLTTSIGFGSLMTSNVKPIHLLGKYTAISIWIIFICCYLTHFGFSYVCKLNLYKKKLRGKGIKNNLLIRAGFLPGIVLIIPICIIIVGAIIVHENPLESNGIKYFPKDHVLRENTNKIEEHIVGPGNIEILIAKPTSEFIDLAFYKKLCKFEDNVKKLDAIRTIISLCQYIKFIRKSIIGFNEYDEESLMITNDDTLLIMQQQIKESSDTSSFTNNKYYRIQIQCNSLSSAPFNKLKLQVKELYAESKFDSEMIFSGILDQVNQIQSYLLQSLSSSLLLTIGLSLILMATFLKKVHILYLAIIPNLFPLGCMACSLYFLDFATTIGTVMVFSISFGIAVDSTIHLFHSFCKYEADGFSEKWLHSLEMNNTAVWITSFILFGAFLLIGVLSSFLPTIQFGVLLAIGMIAAWLGDVSFLPVSLRLYMGRKHD